VFARGQDVLFHGTRYRESVLTSGILRFTPGVQTLSFSEIDLRTMLAVIQSVSKRRLARAAKVSTRSIPSDEAAADAISVKELRRLFDVASALAIEDRDKQISDQVLVQWISEQVRERGLTATDEMLEYDAANLAKVLAGKRALPARLRKRVNELIGGSK